MAAMLAWVEYCKSTVVAIITIVVLFLVLIWVSIFTYWSFYYAYVPAMSHTKDVNFIFKLVDRPIIGLVLLSNYFNSV